MKRAAFFVAALIMFFSPGTYALDLSDGGERTADVLVSEKNATHQGSSSLTEDDKILVRPSRGSKVAKKKDWSYVVSTGGAVAIHDEDFKDFIDYGASASFGVKKKIQDKLSILATLDLSMLQGEWNAENSRESILIEEETYHPGLVPDDPDQVITEEDKPERNLGTSYHSEGEATVISAELLRSIDIDTTLYIIPLTINAVYELHEGEKKINPYIGGGLGFCLARREVESKAIKEQYLAGPEYTIALDDDETVFGQLLQVFAGIEVPLKNNVKFVATASTALYNLKEFEPILEISHTNPTPEWCNEDPIQIGVFKEEFISSLSIGIVIPF